jgi:hypothetical protein
VVFSGSHPFILEVYIFSLGGLGFWFRGLGLGVFSKSIPRKQNLFPAPF